MNIINKVCKFVNNSELFGDTFVYSIMKVLKKNNMNVTCILLKRILFVKYEMHTH